MKFSLPLLLFCLAAGPWSLQAQNAGCDGQRYKADVFAAVTKTTVVYANSISVSNTPINLSVDIYQPTGDTLTKRPVVILAHGGSFFYGNKSDMQSWCELLARKGYVAASIQYRLFSAFSFPDSFDIMDTAIKAVGDMKAAVRFFRLDAATTDQFKIDPDHIFIGGYSAGAVTALHAAYLDSNDVMPPFISTLLAANGGLEGISGSPANHSYSSKVEAVINMSGGMYRSHWIDAGEPPLNSIHGTADATVPYTAGLSAGIAYLEGSSLLHVRAEAEGVPNFLETATNGDHFSMYQQPQFVPNVTTFWTQTTSNLEALVCAVSGSESPQELANQWVIAPNPAVGGRVRIYLPVDLSSVDVTVFDALGRAVLAQKGVSDQADLSVGALPGGVYSVQLSVPGMKVQRLVVPN